MNTTDRSTGTLDYALRRRFAFVTLKSDSTVIAKHYDMLGNSALKDKAIALVDDILMKKSRKIRLNMKSFLL